MIVCTFFCVCVPKGTNSIFIYLCIYFYCCSSTVVSIFPPSLSSASQTFTSHPQSFPPLWFCPWVLYTCSLMTLSSIFPHYLSPPSPLVTVSLFISVTPVVFCLLVCFVDYVPPIGEIIWYLSFTTWLILHSIMLSRSIHVVTKGRSSFFLSTA